MTRLARVNGRFGVDSLQLLQNENTGRRHVQVPKSNDPLADVRVLKSVRFVMKDGRVVVAP